MPAGVEPPLSRPRCAGKWPHPRIHLYRWSVDDVYILGIESSCDETAAAVVRRARKLISNVVYSQIATHQPYGGVVPELASREHLRAIVPVVRKALDDAGRRLTRPSTPIAVTKGPGLAGCAAGGLSYAKALASPLDKPLIAVNHLEGHIHAVLLEERQKGNRELRISRCWPWWSAAATRIFIWPRRSRSLALPRCRTHARRCGRRGFRQGRQAAGTGISGRTGHRSPGQAWQSAGGKVSLRADQAPRPQSAESPLRRRARVSTSPTAESRRPCCATWKPTTCAN